MERRTSITVDQERLSCRICLDLLQDPVTIPCGHSYCMRCIKGIWGQDDHNGVYRCPECRETFSQRPILRKNTMFAELVENVKKTRLQAAPPAHCYTGPGDVACDFCSKKKLKAVKSCLVCLASYCEAHLQPHYESPALKRHKLVKATGNLRKKICSHHDKLLNTFCHTDQQLICDLCAKIEHRGHDMVSSAAERLEKQKQLSETKSEFQWRIQEREQELQDLRQAVQSFKHSAREAVEDSERIFAELIRSIKGRCSEVKQLIRDQERAEVSRAERLLERLEEEIAELKRTNAELEQLSHTDDHIHFLQSCQSLCVHPGPTDLPRITVSPHISFEAVRKSVSDLKGLLEEACEGELVKVPQTVEEIHILQTRTSKRRTIKDIQRSIKDHTTELKIREPKTREDFLKSIKDHTTELKIREPKTREDFLKYCCRLTLDPNTANRHLRLSAGNKEVTCVKEVQPYPDHPERFDHSCQVLCREGLSGRCYWEAEWSGDWVAIALSSKDISRKGQGHDSTGGNNNKFWSLRCCPFGYSFWHDNQCIQISALPSSRVGVYLDHRAGHLSFYNISDTMTLLHRVQTMLTQPLYPVFGFRSFGSSVKL